MLFVIGNRRKIVGGEGGGGGGGVKRFRLLVLILQVNTKGGTAGLLGERMVLREGEAAVSVLGARLRCYNSCVIPP
jgi:hypothetical protein